MKRTSFVLASLAGAAFRPPPAACLAFSRFRSSARPPPRRSNGEGRGPAPRTRASRLRSSKITDGLTEEGPTTTPPSNANGSAGKYDGNVESRNVPIGDIDGTAKQNRPFGIDGERSVGILVLLTVPLAWGTYTPVVKYMYERMDPPVPGFVFSAGYYLVAAASLGILTRLQDGRGDADDQSNGPGDPTLRTKEEVSDDASITARGGWELGSYLFVGNGLQVVGLQTVPADRAAFLVQLTTVMVPLLSAFLEGRLSAVPLQTWIACIIAFAGVIVMGADDGVSSRNVGDGSEAALFFEKVDLSQLSNSLQMSRGDILIVCAAIAYTLHVVRLGAYAPRISPLNLAASKASTEAFLSVVLVIGLAFVGSTHFPSPEFVGQTGSDVAEYFRTIASVVGEGGPTSAGTESAIGASIGAILWTGWVTCAYTIYAQSFGQRRVGPTESNLIYTTQPLFSSLFAFLLLGETLGFYGYVGAALIGTALYLVSFSENDA